VPPFKTLLRKVEPIPQCTHCTTACLHCPTPYGNFSEFQNESISIFSENLENRVLYFFGIYLVLRHTDDATITKKVGLSVHIDGLTKLAPKMLPGPNSSCVFTTFFWLIVASGHRSLWTPCYIYLSIFSTFEKLFLKQIFLLRTPVHIKLFRSRREQNDHSEDGILN